MSFAWDIRHWATVEDFAAYLAGFSDEEVP